MSHGDARPEVIQVEGAAAISEKRTDIATFLKSSGIDHSALAVGDIDRMED